MAFCIQCGQELVEGANFCVRCGVAISEKDVTIQRKRVYDGEIHKCPNCGEVLESFISNCPSCGYELRGIRSTNSLNELVKKLDELDSKRPPKKVGNVFKVALSGGQLTDIDERKVELIKNFFIPNTKEDILEFIILSSSNIDTKLYGMEYHSGQVHGMIFASQKAVSDAWLAKFEQAYQKAKLLLEGTQEFLDIKALYERKMKEIKKKQWQFLWLILGLFGSVILMFGIVLLILILTGSL